MKKLGIISLLGAFVASSIVMFATSAWAIPAFARKYNVECNLCHTLPPRLTKAGVAFKENAYEMPSGIPQFERTSNVVLSEQEPRAEVLPSLPYSLRLTMTGTLSRSYNPAPAAASTAALPAIALPALGAQAGGNIGGFGFWLNGITALTEYQVDYKFADMFKLKFGNFQPASIINYGLGFSPINLGRNPLSSQISGTSGFTFGNIPTAATTGTAMGLELHGTTDAANGLGFNYAVGYLTPGTPAATTNATNANSAIYGGVGYLAESINTWFAVSYLSVNNDGNVAGATSNTLLPSVTWNVGNNFQIIGAYISTNTTTAAGVTTNTNGWSIQPEYNMERWWIGARYGSFGRTAAGVPAAASPNTYAVGVGYRFLQNVIGSINVTNFANQGFLAPTGVGAVPTAGNINTASGWDINAVTATFDFIL